MTDAPTRGATLLVLVGHALRQISRDRASLILTFIAPVIAALIAAAALGAPPRVEATIAVVGTNAAIGDVSQLTRLAVPVGDDANVHVTWKTVSDENAALAMVGDGSASAALIVPSDGGAQPVRVVVNRNVRMVADLAISAGRTVTARLNATDFAGAPAGSGAAVMIDEVPTTRAPLNRGELYGPVIAVFFLFLAAGFVARGLQADRERGTLHRMRSLPVSTGVIVSSKLVAMLILAVGEFTVVLATMSLVYDAQWGDLLAVSTVGLALALAIGAIAICIAAFSRSYQAAAALVAFTALAFAVLGGNLVPLRNLPDAARTVARVTPNGVAIAAMRDIAANSYGVDDVVGSVVVILGFALIFGMIGYAQLRRRLEA